MKKLNVAVIFGGKSAEHEVSLVSANNIVKALGDRYQVHLLAIDKKGYWHRLESQAQLEQAARERKLPMSQSDGSTVTLVSSGHQVELWDLKTKSTVGRIDLAFPVLHGPFGEDGSLQGYLKTLNLAFVGSSVLGSAVGMDKDVMKRLLRDAGLPIGKFLVLERENRSRMSFQSVTQELGNPVFVKSANLGSSVGVHKVKDAKGWEAALDDAFLYDHKVVIETYLPGREIECSVLGYRSLKASLPGEIKPTHEFYSYEAKYLDENGAALVIPAELPGEMVEKVRELSIRTCQVLCCEGLARVDFFLKASGELYINEINTLPGFTSISMYPKMWEASGLKPVDLIDQLIECALKRHQADQELKTSRDS